MRLKKNPLRKGVLLTLSVLFLLLNAMAFMHAWKFTHFVDAPVSVTSEKLSATGKLKALFLGIDNPRPNNDSVPSVHFEVVRLQSNRSLEGWWIPAPAARGTVILFHGYRGKKSGMLDKAAAFRDSGYHTFLVDFMGSGGSEGSSTSIGYAEAEQVKTAVSYAVTKGARNLHLFGTSMGAVAIMKALQETELPVRSLILECPFGTMYQTVCARFRNMGVPTVPLASLLVFWGGVQQGYWAFSHNPATYAEKIRKPVLLLWGEKDVKVSREETDAIFHNLKGPKKLVTFAEAGHENYLKRYGPEWKREVGSFLTALPPQL